MKDVLQITFRGWTATPKMPFILSGNSVCMPSPSYSILLGILGCCVGRTISPYEVKIGFRYSFDSVNKDIETRQRLEFDGRKIKPHQKGSDAYMREFHTMPKLTLWLDRTDWKEHFINPVGTPALGRSQDLLFIEKVKVFPVKSIEEAEISGCMLPYTGDLKVGGQLIQMAEAFEENEEIGTGRKAIRTGIFIAIPPDQGALARIPNLYETKEDNPSRFYMHDFSTASW